MQAKQSPPNGKTSNSIHDDLTDLVKVYEAHKTVDETLLHQQHASDPSVAQVTWRITDKGTGG